MKTPKTPAEKRVDRDIKAWHLIVREGVTVAEAARRSRISKRQLFRRLSLVRQAMATTH